jgi:hypothetical protein
MKIAVVCVVTPYSSERARRFGLHFQGRRVSQVSNQLKQVTSRLATCIHAGIFLGLFDPEDGGDILLRNVSRLSTNYTALYPGT